MRFFIHPLFLLTAVVAISFTATDFFIALTIAVVLHELAHALVAKHLGAVIARVALTPFGGALNLKTKILSVRQKCLIYLTGPVASLLLSMFFGVVVWLFPTIFSYLEYLVASNFLVGVINLLPIYPLDGGKVLAQLVSVKYILVGSNLVFAGLLIWNLIVFNWWWIFFSIVMIIQINWDFKQIIYYDKFSYNGSQKIGQFVRCAVLSSTSLLEAYRMVNRKKPTEFIITDQGNQMFYEADLEKWLIDYSLDTKISRCLS